MRRRGTLPLPLALALSVAGCGREPDARPNVLLISLDSVRADFIGAYGAKLPHAPGRSPSPNLDRLAAEGVLFERALSTTSWTLPAHVSMLTGVPELVHGVEQDGQSIPPDLPTLAETLRARGYRTYGVYSGPYLDPRYGFARGFERYESGYGPELANAADELAVAEKLVASIDVEHEPERARVAVGRREAAEDALERASHRDVSSQRVTDLVLEELERAAKDRRPFFVFAHYFDPHYDYNPPPPYWDAFDPDYDGTIGPRDYFTSGTISVVDRESPTGRKRVVDERGLEHLQALYAGEIAWTDARIGLVLDVLAQRGLAGNTLVIVVGDHGDEFFEHGSIGHRQTLHEEVVRVPWIMRLPGKLAAGERRADWKPLCEVSRTILELMDPDAPASRSSAADGLGRLVNAQFVSVVLSGHGDSWSTRSDVKDSDFVLSIHETFREGPIKIARVQPLPRSEEVRSLLESRHGSDEQLRWIDLDAHPDEPDDAWSSTFVDPRARAALMAFRRAHAALSKERRSPPLVPASADMLAALRGLGYAGQEARVGTVASDELVLPPPGEALLGESERR